MPSYRGVDREQIIGSIRRAKTALQKMKVGKATDLLWQCWDREAPHPLRRLTQAKDDRQLVVAMKHTISGRIFMRSAKVFAYHAAAEALDGKKTEMQKIYKDLSAWGAFTQDMSPGEWQTLEDEATEYVTAQCLKRLTLEDCRPGSTAYVVFQEFLTGLEQKDFDTADWLGRAVPLFAAMRKDDHDDEIAVIRKGYSEKAPYLLRALYNMTGLKEAEAGLKIEPLFRPYRLTVDMPKSNSKKVWNDLGLIESSLQAYLAPFRELAEVTGEQIVLIRNPEQTKAGLIFSSTARVAQAIANSMPQHMLLNMATKKPVKAQPKGTAPGASLPPSP